MASKYNLNNPAIKRIMREVSEMEREPNSSFTARPLEDNLFEWHFTIRGARDTPFEGGIYHGRIILPADYPFQPPEIALLTPSGRFEVGTKICLSLTAHHPELWQPGWSIRTVLLALISFMPTKGEGAIGALDYTESERRELAKRSRSWKCPKCGCDNATVLPPEPEPSPSPVETTPKTQTETPSTPATPSITNNTNTSVTNNLKPTVTTPQPTTNNNNNIQDVNNNNYTAPPQPVNANQYQYPAQANQFQPHHANQYRPQYQGNQPNMYANQYQQPNQNYAPANVGNQRPPVSDAVRRQQAFLDLVILSLFFVIIALIVNKLAKAEL